ncbi:MAG: hypothetical protein K9G49_10690 [Taibaiella sp.]|nr:hypothetical protein [Taibaiella sp.]
MVKKRYKLREKQTATNQSGKQTFKDFNNQMPIKDDPGFKEKALAPIEPAIKNKDTEHEYPL